MSLSRCVHALEHLHKLAAVQNRDLGVGMLKVQFYKPSAELSIGKRRLTKSRLRMQTEEAIALPLCQARRDFRGGFHVHSPCWYRHP